MDNTLFDAHSRTLSEARTRRGALAVLGGLAGLGLSEVASKRRPRRDKPRDRGHGNHDHEGHGHGGHGAPGGKVTI